VRRVLVVSVVLAVAVLGAAPGALAGGDEDRASDATGRRADARSFTFYGSGFGHGLGMSQWGAYGLSRQGWGSKQILAHYYSGTRVEPQQPPVDRLRIGLVQNRGAVRLEAEGGSVDLRLGSRTGDVVATVPDGQTWRIKVSGDEYRVLDATGATVARAGDPETPIVAVYESPARAGVPEAGHAYGRGWIEFGLYDCAGGCAMRLVLLISPEEYLYGLGEVPSSWPSAALQAQAIAARTYAFTKAAASQHRPECDCALYASSFDQVYAGWDKESGLDGDRWVAAVDATAGEVVVEGEQTIQAFYMSSSGGHTEDNENVWGGDPIDYLRGVCDPGDYTTDNPSAIWEVTLNAPEVTQALSLGIGTVTGFVNAVRGVSGRIVSITVRGENGSTSVSGSTLRSALALRDDRVWIDRDRQVTGDIRVKYDALGCSPGLPTSPQVAVAGGLRQSFESGTIFFQDAAGPHELHGAVLDFYLAKGGPGGRFGFPLTDVRPLANGNLRARFEHGTITCDESSCRRS
jgi:SpoIID/LytB domain protein